MFASAVVFVVDDDEDEDEDEDDIPAMLDGNGLAKAMLDLDGVRVADVREANGEVTIEV